MGRGQRKIGTPSALVTPPVSLDFTSVPKFALSSPEATLAKDSNLFKAAIMQALTKIEEDQTALGIVADDPRHGASVGLICVTMSLPLSKIPSVAGHLAVLRKSGQVDAKIRKYRKPPVRLWFTAG